MKTWIQRLALLAFLPFVAACGPTGPDDGPNPDKKKQTGETRIVELQASGIGLGGGDAIAVSVAGLSEGVAETVSSLRVTNAGQQTLTLSAITVASAPPGAFTLRASGSAAMPGEGRTVELDRVGGAGTLGFYFELVYEGQGGDSTPPTGTVTIRSDATFPTGSEVLVFPIAVKAAAPKLTVSPAALDFEVVSEGSKNTRSLTLLNTGENELVVHKLLLTGHIGFAFLIENTPYTREEAAAGIELSEPIRIAPKTAAKLPLSYTPLGPEPANATLVVFSNDPSGGAQGTPVPLQANTSGPCIIINPKKVSFGGKLIGKPATISVSVESCGDGPLEIRSLGLRDTGSTDFSLDLSGLGFEGVGSTGVDDAPLVLAVNEVRIFEVTFVPDEINPLDGDGVPIPDLGIIDMTTNSFKGELAVEVRGFGVETECPTAIIAIAQGEEVIPQTKLNLTGSQSYTANGVVSAYAWEVEQPAGSQSIFFPSATAADPTFEVNVAGIYVFRLRIWDANGEESCVAAEATVVVNPDEAIHVELLWDTPNDPNQTDEGPEAGADLDLHFKHPFATGEDVDGDGTSDGWFDQPFDSFWFNPQPNWASLDPLVDDDPGLDRDDTDGAGPENVNLNLPQDGLEYCVAVHYWNDHGFGVSRATVRVYIHSTLVFELPGVELVNHDLWEVACIQWPSGKVNLITEEGGDYRIVPNYQNSLFGD